MMNIKIALYILVATLLVACSSSKLAKQEAAQMETAPAWVNERPVNSAYYIGIAKVLKASYPNNYQEIAKKKALNDMASEISVNIQSNSIVSSYEDQAGFQSEFSNYIQMEMSKDLSGYQMQGSFESPEKYMVYYRLSKSKWKQIQAERKKAAADKAYTLYVQAKKEEKELNYPAAIKSYLNALLEIKKYWNESVFYTFDAQQQRLDLAIQSSLITILSSFSIEVFPSKLELNIDNDFKSNIEVVVKNKQGDLLKDFPLQIYYRKQSMPYQATVFSKVKTLIIPIENLQYRNQGLYVNLEIDKDKVLPIKSEDRRLLKFISDAFVVKTVKIPVNYLLPKIFITSKDIGNINYHHIGNAIKQALGKQSFMITSNSKKADLYFDIDIHESNGNTDSQIKTAYLTYSIEVKEHRNGNTVYTFSSPKYKGVDYTMESAREKSYIKAASEISESSFKDMLQSIIE